ncbi:MAG: hypothetical protein P1U40_09185 [Coxiellaceae bacterium]|nr:hypothetical protein [Coxiellaceae bacterium]
MRHDSKRQRCIALFDNLEQSYREDYFWSSPDEECCTTLRDIATKAQRLLSNLNIPADKAIAATAQLLSDRLLAAQEEQQDKHNRSCDFLISAITIEDTSEQKALSALLQKLVRIEPFLQQTEDKVFHVRHAKSGHNLAAGYTIFAAYKRKKAAFQELVDQPMSKPTDLLPVLEAHYRDAKSRLSLRLADGEDVTTYDPFISATPETGSPTLQLPHETVADASLLENQFMQTHPNGRLYFTSTIDGIMAYALEHENTVMDPLDTTQELNTTVVSSDQMNVRLLNQALNLKRLETDTPLASHLMNVRDLMQLSRLHPVYLTNFQRDHLNRLGSGQLTPTLVDQLNQRVDTYGLDEIRTQLICLPAESSLLHTLPTSASGTSHRPGM